MAGWPVRLCGVGRSRKEAYHAAFGELGADASGYGHGAWPVLGPDEVRDMSCQQAVSVCRFDAAGEKTSALDHEGWSEAFYGGTGLSRRPGRGA